MKKKVYEKIAGVPVVKLIARLPEPLRDDLKKEAWICRMSLNTYLLELWDRRKDSFDKIKYLSDLRAREDGPKKHKNKH